MSGPQSRGASPAINIQSEPHNIGRDDMITHHLCFGLRVALFDLRNIDILVAEGSITMIITTDCLRATEAAIDYCSTTCTGAAEGGLMNQ